MFLPLPIETVRKAWEEWRANNNHDREEEIRFLETSGGCFIVTSAGRPPRVIIELLKSFLSQKAPLARAS